MKTFACQWSLYTYVYRLSYYNIEMLFGANGFPSLKMGGIFATVLGNSHIICSKIGYESI